MTIPKILHFTWKTKTLTRPMQRIFDKWRQLHPDWDIRLYDDDDIRALVSAHYPDHLGVFDAYPRQIFRADVFRFFVLHHHGGVYSDLDVVPQGGIDELLEQTECFVGAEPESHVRANDARYRGMPFVLCNAFMGSVRGHPFWERCISRLAACAVSDVVDATGPRFVNGVALTAPSEVRPDVLPPNYWSPLDGDGRHSPTPDTYVAAIARHFRIVGRGEPALVSHLWSHTWISPFSYKGPRFWRIPNGIKWELRKLRHRDLAETRIAPPAITYDVQALAESTDTPVIYLAVAIDGEADVERLGAVMEKLAYPRDRLRVGLMGAAAERLFPRWEGQFSSVEMLPGDADCNDARNRAAEHASRQADFCLFMNGKLVDVPPHSLAMMLGTGRPVVTASVSVPGEGGQDGSAFLYHADLFKYLYRHGARAGVLDGGADGERLPLRSFRYLNIAPLSCVGSDFLLVDCSVVRAGARFATKPYKFHVGSEAFALQARDLGFEVCALPGLEVRLG